MLHNGSDVPCSYEDLKEYLDSMQSGGLKFDLSLLEAQEIPDLWSLTQMENKQMKEMLIERY